MFLFHCVCCQSPHMVVSVTELSALIISEIFLHTLCTATITNAKIEENQCFIQNHVQNNLSESVFVCAQFAVLSIFTLMHNGCFYHKIMKTSLGVMTVIFVLARNKDKQKFQGQGGAIGTQNNYTEKITVIIFLFHTSLQSNAS